MLTQGRSGERLAAAKRSHTGRRRLRGELLETRRLLSADMVLADGVVEVVGTEGADQIVATLFDDSLILRVNKVTVVYPSEDVKKISVSARGGDDAIWIRHSVVQETELDGGDGNDFVHGSRNNDVIRGGLGNDLIFGLAGNDVIDGGLGNDHLHGGAGDDDIQGGFGNDTLFGNSGNDQLTGDPDLVAGVSGESSWSGNDWIDGGAGDDTLRGGVGRDVLFGRWGDDQLEGGSGDDTLSGGLGNDTLLGEAGKDRLWGNLGQDHLDGGAGPDMIWAIDGVADTVVADEADTLFLDRHDRFLDSLG